MTEQQSRAGAFASFGRAYFEVGLAVTPAGGADGKVPLLKGYQKKLLSPEAIAIIARRNPDANLAIVTGLSKLAVIDVDDSREEALSEALDRFGATPLIGRTGRGRFQAYYKGHPDLRPHDFRHSENRPLELKVDGNIVIAPPSVNFMTGRMYEFIEGRLEDVPSLPTISIRSVPQVAIKQRLEGRRLSESVRRIVEIGERNDWLFRQCLLHAPSADDLEALIDVAQTRAEEYFSEPMTDAEIEKTARAAWGYQVRGENWVGSYARLPLALHQLRELEARCNSDAIVLALHLQLAHGGRMKRGETFAVDASAMAEAKTIHGWSRSRIIRARDSLLDAGILVKVRQGWGRGLPSQYLIELPTGLSFAKENVRR